MFFAASAVGAAAAAAGSALDLLSSLTPGKSGSATTGVKQPNSLFNLTGPTQSAQTSTPAPSVGSAPTGTLSPSTFNALLVAQDPTSSSPTDALKDLFAQIDGNGDGKITKAEFENTLGAGGTNIQAADNVFTEMDADGDGSVSMNEMAAALKGNGGAHQAHHSSGGGGGGGGADALMQALQGASSTTTTNSDGSITTTLTYADGTKLTMSQPALPTPSGGASSQYNLVDKMMQRQTDALATAAKQSVLVRV